MKDRVPELLGIGLTTARYGLAELMARQVRHDKPIALTMGAFIVADILDGAILRRFDLDTPARRITDGIVDHVSQARVASEIMKKHPETVPYVGALAIRAAAVGGLNALHLMMTGEPTKGLLNQKLTSLASASFAVIATKGNERATETAGIIASGIAAITAPNHVKDIGKAHPNGIRELSI